MNQNSNTNALTKLYGTNNTGVNKLTSVYGTNNSNDLIKSEQKSGDLTPILSTSNSTKTSNNILAPYLNNSTYTEPITLEQETAYEKLLKELSGGQGYDASKEWNQQEFLKQDDWKWEDIIKAQNAYKGQNREKQFTDNTNLELEQATIEKEKALKNAYINNEFAKKNLQSNLQSRGLGTSGVASAFDTELFNMYLNNMNYANATYKNDIKEIKNSYDNKLSEYYDALGEANDEQIAVKEEEEKYNFISDVVKLQNTYGNNTVEYNNAYKQLLDNYKNKLNSLDYSQYVNDYNKSTTGSKSAMDIGNETWGFVVGGGVTIELSNGQKYNAKLGKEIKDNEVVAAGATYKDGQAFIYNGNLYIKKGQIVRELKSDKLQAIYGLS